MKTIKPGERLMLWAVWFWMTASVGPWWVGSAIMVGAIAMDIARGPKES